MISRVALPDYEAAPAGRLVLLEAPEASARLLYVESWILKAREAGAEAWVLSCDLDSGGVWTGLRNLVREIALRAESEAPELLRTHAAELSLVVPTLRRTLTVSNRTLTDTAESGEKVRNYPRDRAYRIVQGMVDFLAAWQERKEAPSWVIVCDEYPKAGELVQFFFRELMRRRGEALHLTLVLSGESVLPEADSFRGRFERVLVRPDLPPAELTESAPETVEAVTAAAASLEEYLKADSLEREERLFEVIQLWLRSGNPEKALMWQGYAFAYCHHYGYYQAALHFAKTVLDHLEEILAANEFFRRWDMVGTICDDYLAVGEPEKALDLIQREAIGKVDDPADRLRIFYALAMIHSRFLKKPDYEKAEQYIESGLKVIEESELPEEEKLILRVFTCNGLAFIRHRQGRPQEAVELCRNGFELLRQNLPEEEHRLHRSVLLYNIGQVYYALHMYQEAVEYYSAAIEFDPNYSEYYNERGNIFLMMERYGDAVADYRDAIRLSAPYQEVWTNMGQAYKLAGNSPAALAAYSRALDLDPDKLLPRVGRAQSYESLGRSEEAIADYSAALDLDPNQPMVLGNRACLYFEAGRPEPALADLNRAIAMSPENPDLLGNRAFLLESQGLLREAAEDLRLYLRLQPDAQDREEIEAKVLSLSSARFPSAVGEGPTREVGAG